MSDPVSTVAAMSMGVVTSWADRADRAYRVLIGRFWDGRRRLFRPSDRRRVLAAPWHYWWQAHALDACVDAVARTGSAEACRRVSDLVAGVQRRNGGRIENDYYDDMAWMGLALLRAEQLGLADAAGLVRRLWVAIRAGWDPRHGGIVWRRGDTYTNTPANAPAAILAARLHRYGGSDEDLTWARRIVDWLHETLVDAQTGIVWDGVHPETGERPSPELYTYNQGTVVGADVELFRCTGDGGHLRRAERTATAALTRLAEPVTGLLPAEGDGDGGLFKGILARYLGDLVTTAPPGSADSASRRVLATLRRNGVAVAQAAPGGTVGPDWARPEAGSGSLSTHLSAVLLLESLARVDTLLPEEISLPPPTD
jgi:predicted alpha-1,6-mannanase (GH76 family)